MNKAIMKLCWLLPLLLCSAAKATGVDCIDSPHTRLELSVCGDPVLRALDSELTDTLQRALSAKVIATSEADRLRNKIARACRRESDQSVGACLLSAEVNALQWVTTRIGDFEPATDHSYNRRRGRSSRDRLTLLEKQLAIAESSLRHTANPDLTVATLLELIAMHQNKLDSDSPESLGSIASLEQRLRSGCDHSQYGIRWQELLRSSALSCTQLRLGNPVYSSTEFY